MKYYGAILFVALYLQDKGIHAQSSNGLGDFVGQLTSLLNQGGGLASALGSYAGGPQGGGLGPAGQGGYYGQPGAPGGYPPIPPELLQGGQGGYGFPARPLPGGIPPPGYGGIPGAPGGGYPQSSLYGALASIAQYDDLRCVPRLLCEVAAGSRPGSNNYASTSSSNTGSFLSRDAIITLLTVLNFVDDSPLLVFGRAAVLGYTARGDPRACLIAYPTCPRDPDKLVDYLNNHNGGFFRFFNQQIPQYAPQYQYYQQPTPYPTPGTLPPPNYYNPQQYYQPQRPLPPPPPPLPPRPLPPSQRPYRKPTISPYQQYYQQQYQQQQQPYQQQQQPYHQQQQYQQQQYQQQYPEHPQHQQQGRIQNKPPGNEYEFITSEGGTSKLIFSSSLKPAQYYQENHNNNYVKEHQQHTQKPTNQANKYYTDYYNTNNDKFVFPTASSSSPAPSVVPLPSTASSIPSYEHDSTGSFSHRETRRGKTLAFPREQTSNSYNQQYHGKPQPTSSTMIFPDRTGTGDLRLDLDEYGGYKTVHFASENNNNNNNNHNYGIFREQRDTIKNTLTFPKNNKQIDTNTEDIINPREETNNRRKRDIKNIMILQNT